MYTKANSTESGKTYFIIVYGSIEVKIYLHDDYPRLRVGSDLAYRGGTLHKIDIVRYHPGYVQNDGKGGCINDIALIRVVKSFKFDKSCQPIPLFDESVRVRPNSQATVVGLGVTDGDFYPDHLLSTTIWITNKTECEIVYANKEQIPLPNSAFCADGRNTTADTCSGDSGGPLVIMERLAGITSFAMLASCGKPYVPGVYTEVSLFRPWLEQYVTLP
ncbi:hypothetical protein QAD02_015591 [Eretmocerus hayati]|uniref:Uncharacterized protein n=1 Tax=Eretmocerus hayati TaxID=131215 RepID=A0ACC2PB38_9HYME|nr:hypothetical protein QAD02_015591 [Eretmocerus hayati]